MKPLNGIKIIDFSTLLPGPLATLILAEAGAEVIKIEKPGGEDMRRSPPFIDGESILFGVLNRGKRSIELDIKSKEGSNKIKSLIKSADVVIDQFRPWVMERLGLDFKNPLGMAAGFDKNVEVVKKVLNLGFGFVEAGTITPQPQFGNDKPRVFRLEKDSAIINHLGFNNKGADYALKKLSKMNLNSLSEGIVGINIGKNICSFFYKVIIYNFDFCKVCKI